MSLVTQIANLATRIATETKAVRTLVNGNAADLSALTTTNKSNLVVALNELKAAIAAIAPGAAIDDTIATSTTKTYSGKHISDLIAAALANLTNGAPAALDQLNELAAALGNDSNFAATVTASLANRVRVDAVQGLTSVQKQQGRDNLDLYSRVEVGDPTTDFVATFNAGLV